MSSRNSRNRTRIAALVVMVVLVLSGCASVSRPQSEVTWVNNPGTPVVEGDMEYVQDSIQLLFPADGQDRVVGAVYQKIASPLLSDQRRAYIFKGRINSQQDVNWSFVYSYSLVDFENVTVSTHGLPRGFVLNDMSLQKISKEQRLPFTLVNGSWNGDAIRVICTRDFDGTVPGQTPNGWRSFLHRGQRFQLIGHDEALLGEVEVDQGTSVFVLNRPVIKYRIYNLDGVYTTSDMKQILASIAALQEFSIVADSRRLWLGPKENEGDPNYGKLPEIAD